MADEQGPIAPEQASQLLDSSFVQDPAVKQQLGTLVAPAPLQDAVAEQPDAQQQFVQQLTQVPLEPSPEIQAKADAQVAPDPANMTKEQRQDYLQKVLDDRMKDQINSGEIDPAEAVKMIRTTKEQEAQATKQQEAASIEGRQSQITEKWNQYLEAKNEIDQFNEIANQTEGIEPKPEPNMLEFLTEQQISFAAESGMEIPPAAAKRAELELEQLDLQKQQATEEQAQRDIANKQEAAQRVAVEEQEKTAKRVEIAKKEIEEEDDRIKGEYRSFEELFNNATTGRKVATAIAVMLGGLSQGLTGATTNPVLAFMDKEFERNTAKHELGLKMLNEKLEKSKNLLKDQKTMLEIQKLQGQIGLQQRDIRAKREFDKVVAQGGEVPESLLTAIGADKESVARIVRGPDGKAYIADNQQVATNLTKAKDEAEPAIVGIDELLELSRNSNRLNLRDRAKIYSRMRALVGKLRIPLTGPGVLTDKEYERLLDTLGDPNKILAIKSIEEEKLIAVKNILQTDLKIRYRNAGVKLPKSKQEKIIEQAVNANPNTPKGLILRVLRKKGYIE